MTESRIPEWGKSAMGGIQPMSQERRHGGVRPAVSNSPSSAERVVISSRDDQAVHELIKQYSDWRMEAQLDQIPTGVAG